MKGIGIMFIGTLMTIPLLTIAAAPTMTPGGAVQALSVGTAQLVLAFVAVIEFLGITFVFNLWRRAMELRHAEEKANSERLIQVISHNSAVIEQNKDAYHRHSRSIDTFKEAVIGFTEVIRKCEGK